MIRKVKAFEKMIIFFNNPFEPFGSKMLLTIKIMDFENVALTKKIVNIYVIEDMNT
jgi:hypothetical protein